MWRETALKYCTFVFKSIGALNVQIHLFAILSVHALDGQCVKKESEK